MFTVFESLHNSVFKKFIECFLIQTAGKEESQHEYPRKVVSTQNCRSDIGSSMKGNLKRFSLYVSVTQLNLILSLLNISQF